MPSLDADHEKYELLSYFNYDHLPEDLQSVSKPCHDLAHQMTNKAVHCESYQLIAGLKRLLEAKDCFVRVALSSRDK